ncbi:hypothetical protein, partial [Streptomyces tendae]|uniref:hypothetical protein n=1 Tax=Streptomyces tendae TaxID=1932 RepID=UPI0036B36FAD
VNQASEIGEGAVTPTNIATRFNMFNQRTLQDNLYIPGFDTETKKPNLVASTTQFVYTLELPLRGVIDVKLPASLLGQFMLFTDSEGLWVYNRTLADIQNGTATWYTIHGDYITINVPALKTLLPSCENIMFSYLKSDINNFYLNGHSVVKLTDYDWLEPISVDTSMIKDKNVTTSKMADKSVTTEKMADESITSDKISSIKPDKLPKVFNMFYPSKSIIDKSLAGTVSSTDLTPVVNNTSGNQVYTLLLPVKGSVTIKVLEPTAGQLFLYLGPDGKVKFRSTYAEQIIQDTKTHNLPPSNYKYDAATSELTLDCRYLREVLSIYSIMISVATANINQFYINGSNVISLADYAWILEGRKNIPTLTSKNVLIDVNSSKLRMNTSIPGYDTTTLLPNYIYSRTLFTYSLDLMNYKNKLLFFGNTDTARQISSAQRLMVYDANGKRLDNMTFAQFTTNPGIVNIPWILKRFPTATKIEMTFLIDDTENYLYAKDIVGETKNIGFEKFSNT